MNLERELEILQEIENLARFKIRQVKVGDETLKSYEDLERYAISNNISSSELDRLLHEATGCFTDTSEIGISEAIAKVKDFVSQFPDRWAIEIPLFVP